jgi:hypothetical protein
MATTLTVPRRDDVVRAGGRLLTVRAVHGQRIDAVRMSSPGRRVEHLALAEITAVIACRPDGAR